jgi:hypothetical protein
MNRTMCAPNGPRTWETNVKALKTIAAIAPDIQRTAVAVTATATALTALARAVTAIIHALS